MFQEVVEKPSPINVTYLDSDWFVGNVDVAQFFILTKKNNAYLTQRILPESLSSSSLG